MKTCRRLSTVLYENVFQFRPVNNLYRTPSLVSKTRQFIYVRLHKLFTFIIHLRDVRLYDHAGTKTVQINFLSFINKYNIR